MPFAPERLQNSEQYKAAPCHRIFARASADNQAVNIPLILQPIGPNSQRTHAVAKEIQRKIRKFTANVKGNLVQIAEQAFCAIFIEIAQILTLFHAAPMTTMIVDNAAKAMIGHKFHEGNVPLLVFGHAMGQLQKRPGLAIVGHRRQNAQLQPIMF